MLEDFIFKFFLTNIVVIITFFMWYKLNNSNEIKSIKANICYVMICLLITANYILINNFIKTVISTLILMIFYYVIYKEKIRNCIITPLFTQLIIMVSELLFALVLVLFAPIIGNEFLYSSFSTIFANVVIGLISLCIINFKFIIKLYNFLLKVTDKIKEKYLMLLFLLLLLIANIYTAFMYYEVNLIYIIIANTTVIGIFIVIIFFYLKTNNNYIKVYDKYTNTLNSLKEYEDILSRYRISNHENKNQLLTIRGMVKNKKVASYIDEIVENKIKDDEKLMFESLIIPEGGLRGLIYSKLLLMKENDIEYDLCIDKKIKTTELTKLDDELVLSICNIVGVYLDNAIEEVKNLDERYIVIEMYKDETLNIAITNNYVGNIDIGSIDNVGYSTKGKGHGYGLSLVKQILDNNKKIKSFRRISEDEFTQEIKIKCK